MNALIRSVVALAALTLCASTALAQSPKEDYFTTSDGIKIHYLTAGTTGSWVVLIHGYSDNAERMWFSTGIAPALAKNHRIVALDNRNHGKSDRPVPGGTGKAEDIIELMDHLGIQKAHIHGYSMGGSLTARLLSMIPGRFITAGFGGSGIPESDPTLRAQADAMDEALPKAQGDDAAAMDRFRQRVATSRPQGTPPVSAQPLTIDLKHLTIPILAVNGSFDSPYAKTQRIWREAPLFQNVILEGKTHLTAIASTGAPPLYIQSMVAFINAYDAR
ncbi:MAG: alpha/beta hydrolase [Acidobacteriaceae bacterium]|jgi:pimeloyl-ACP methyl ester carboxylesterase|nr:alpha/beta hydrolase [Acidobacteriaceae bacterium]